MNSKDLIKYGLIALGAYLIYEYIQKNGGLAGIFGTTPDLKNPTVGQTATLAQLAAANIGDFASLLQEQPNNAGAIYKWSGSVWSPPGTGYNPASTSAPASITGQSAACTALAQKVGGVAKLLPTDPNFQQIMGMVTLSADQQAMLTACGGVDLTASQVAAIHQIISTPPTTPPNPPPTGATHFPFSPPQTISQKMLAAAGTNLLNTDQWSFYYSQVTGLGSPVDPGSIDPSVYAGAFPPGTTNADGSPPDRTTPTDVGTWLAIMQNQAPQLGLTGLGARYTPAWLM